MTPLLQQPSVSVLLGEPRSRTSAHQISLNLLLVSQQGSKALLKPRLGRLTVPKSTSMNLKSLLFAALSQFSEGCDSGSESFHQDRSEGFELLAFMKTCLRLSPTAGSTTPGKG
jgi:hypothetical protein